MCPDLVHWEESLTASTGNHLTGGWHHCGRTGQLAITKFKTFEAALLLNFFIYLFCYPIKPGLSRQFPLLLVLLLFLVNPPEWGRVQSDMQGWCLPRLPLGSVGSQRVTKWGRIPCSPSPQHNRARNSYVIPNVGEGVFIKPLPALFQEAFSTALDRIHFSSL